LYSLVRGRSKSDRVSTNQPCQHKMVLWVRSCLEHAGNNAVLSDAFYETLQSSKAAHWRLAQKYPLAKNSGSSTNAQGNHQGPQCSHQGPQPSHQSSDSACLDWNCAYLVSLLSSMMTRSRPEMGASSCIDSSQNRSLGRISEPTQRWQAFKGGSDRPNSAVGGGATGRSRTRCRTS